MGNSETKLHFRKAVIQLTTKTQPVDVQVGLKYLHAFLQMHIFNQLLTI